MTAGTAGERQCSGSSGTGRISGQGSRRNDDTSDDSLVTCTKLNSIIGTRKTNKPLMEKRRRARINRSLSELERLIVIPNEEPKNGSAKLEKADILEITVKYLKDLCRVQQAHINDWSQGFNECIEKARDFLQDSSHSRLCQEMTTHLTTACTNKMESASELQSVSDSIPIPAQESYDHNHNHNYGCCSPQNEPESEPQPMNLARWLPEEDSINRKVADSMWRPWSYRGRNSDLRRLSGNWARNT